MEVAVDGGGRDHSGVRGRVGDVVALLAAVARGGDDDGALLQCVLDGGVLGGFRVGGDGVVAEGEIDDVGAVVGGPADAVGECAAPAGAGFLAGRVAVLEDHADGQDLRLGGDAEYAVVAARAVAVTGDDPGHGGAVPRPGAVAPLGSEADEVLGGQDVALEVGVGFVHTGVEDGDRDALALGRAPGLLGVHGVQAPLLGADGVGVGGGRREQREGRGGRERGGGVPPGGGRAGHDGSSVALATAARRLRSTRSAMPCASWPRPACAGVVTLPDFMASAAGCGSVTVRASAKPETA